MNKKNVKYFSLLLLSFFAGVQTASAHVGYVITHDELGTSKGMDFQFLMQPFFNISYIGLMLGTVVVVGVVWFLLLKNKKIVKYFADVTDRLSSYHELVPWILRLALGIALLGAGTEHVLISPLLTNSTFAMFEIILGFLLLLGFMIIPATLLVIVLYVLALTQNWYLIGNLDVLALALSVIVFHSPRPGLDDMLGTSFLHRLSIRRELIAPIIRFGLGGAMIYLALFEKILNPHMSALVVSQYHLQSFLNVSPAMWVLATGLIELVIGIAIFIGLKTRLSSIIAFVVVSGTFFYFKESVTAHITLFGGLSILAIEGGGLWSIDRLLEQRKKLNFK